MMKRYLIPTTSLAALLMLTGCIDDNYDLSNIDKTSQVAVNDLVIPMNLKPVILNSIIDIKDSEVISEEDYIGPIPELQGKKVYVFHYDGDFESDDFHINSFTVKSPENLNPSTVRVELFDNPAIPSRKAPGLGAFTYDIKNDGTSETSFSYHVNDVDNKVKSIEGITTPGVSFSATLKLPASIFNNTSKVELENVKVQFPTGLYAENGDNAHATVDGKSGYAIYNAADGYVTIKDYELTSPEFELRIVAQDVELDIQMENGGFDYNGSIDIKSGTLYLYPKPSVIPDPVFNITTSYNLSSFDISTFTGKIDYEIDGLSFENVKLDDLPKFLAQKETKINIANPQLYLDFYNTCAPYNLGGSTTLKVTPYRDGIPGEPIPMDQPIVVGYSNKNIDIPYQFAISPEGRDLTPIESYKNAEKLSFTDFGKILYGDGIPSEIEVEFDNPVINGTANKFPIGNDKNIPAVHGNYNFRAPLALSDGSIIGYSGTEDDWDSEELEDLYVNRLQISANISSDIPMDVKLTAHVLGEKGKKIGQCDATLLPAMAKDVPFTLTITPDEGYEYISGIKGIYYEATAESTTQYDKPEDVPALSPEMTLILTDLRAKVNGYYLYKEDDNNK